MTGVDFPVPHNRYNLNWLLRLRTKRQAREMPRRVGKNRGDTWWRKAKKKLSNDKNPIKHHTHTNVRTKTMLRWTFHLYRTVPLRRISGGVHTHEIASVPQAWRSTPRQGVRRHVAECLCLPLAPNHAPQKAILRRPHEGAAVSVMLYYLHHATLDTTPCGIPGFSAQQERQAC